MDLRQIRYFVAVAEELHMGRAALRLHISQPPLSMQIASLEAKLDVKLFSRANRRLALTPAGKELLRRAYQILDDVSIAAMATKRAGAGEIGVLSVGFVAAMSYSYIPVILREFAHQFPQIELSLHEMWGNDQRAALRTGRLDIGFLRPPVGDEGLQSEVVLSEPYSVALCDDHELCEDPIDLLSLKDEPFIMMKHRQGLRVHNQSMELCRNAGFTPRVVHQTLDLHTQVGLVSSGLGVAIVPDSARFFRVRGVRYVGIVPTRFSPQSEVSIVWRRDDDSPLVQNFRQVTTQVMKRKGSSNPMVSH